MQQDLGTMYHQLRTRRALLLYKVNGNSAFLVLNGTSLICNSALLALSWRYRLGIYKLSQTWQFVAFMMICHFFQRPPPPRNPCRHIKHNKRIKASTATHPIYMKYYQYLHLIKRILYLNFMSSRMYSLLVYILRVKSYLLLLLIITQ